MSGLSQQIFQVVAFFFMLLSNVDCFTYWENGGACMWTSMYPTSCASRVRQSPIDIHFAQTHYDQNLKGSKRDDTYSSISTNQGMEIQNDGLKVHMSYPNAKITMKGFGLPSIYVLDHLHLHWGIDNNIGSEHLYNGVPYPLELHIVHYLSSYASLSEAIRFPDSVAVLGVFFKIGKANQEMEIWIKKLSNIIVNNTNAEIEAGEFPPAKFLPEDTCDHARFYRYYGSLTTPNCNEAVIWTVFHDPIEISSSQMDKFRKLTTTMSNGTVIPMVNNYRPPQLLNGRKVYRSFESLTTCAALSLGVPHVNVLLSLLAISLVNKFFPLLR